MVSPSSDFVSSLAYGLIKQERIASELPEILAAWDAGEAVNLEAIKDVTFKYVMEMVVSHLQCLKYDANHGWYKPPDCASVSGAMLSALLKARAIRQPTELDSAQTLAFRAAPHFHEMIKEYPGLVEELPLILEALLDGQEMDISSLDNLELRDSLKKFFIKIDVQPRGGPFEFALNKKSRDHVAISATRYFLRTLKNIKRCDIGVDPTSEGEAAVAFAAPGTRAPDGGVVQGAAIPSVEELRRAQAAQAAAVYNAPDDNDSSSDDEDADVGPMPSVVPARGEAAGAPLATIDQRAVPAMVPTAAMLQEEAEAAAAAAAKAGGREEWMLAMGENKSIAQALGGEGGDGVRGEQQSRKFGASKGAKKEAAKVMALRQAQKEAFEASDEGKMIRATMEAEAETRGGSLLEQHMAKKQRREGEERAAGGSHYRKRFDHEKEMGMHTSGRGDKAAAKLLVEQAKHLASKFDSTIQRHF